MKVTFDKDGYVEMLIKKGDLPNSIELPDDDTIDMKYLSCYKLGFDNSQLVLDAKKVQRIEDNISANNQIYNLEKSLADTDYKVLRHIREKALGLKTTLNDDEYLMLEAERESNVRKIREIKGCTKLETEVMAILGEGLEERTKNVVPVVNGEVIEETPTKTTAKRTSKKKTE